jgi:hypothetical protein
MFFPAGGNDAPRRAWTLRHLLPIVQGSFQTSRMIETFLIAAGCAQAQGFYFSRPVPGARATELLRQRVIKPGRSPLRMVEPAA